MNARSQIESAQRVLCVLFVSRGRPMRLESALRSFYQHCSDAYDLKVVVDFPVCDAMTTAAYEIMSLDYPAVDFRCSETLHSDGQPDGQSDAAGLLLVSEDCLFVAAFDSQQVLAGVADDGTLAMALAVGGNTAGAGAVPVFEAERDRALGYRLGDSEGHFAAPLESCAVAISKAVLSDLPGVLSCTKAADLRSALSELSRRSPERWQYASCPVTSGCFRVPETRVEGSGVLLDETLTAAYLCGSRIDLGPLAGLVPDRAEASIPFKLGAASDCVPLAPITLPMDGRSNFMAAPRGVDEAAGPPICGDPVTVTN